MIKSKKKSSKSTFTFKEFNAGGIGTDPGAAKPAPREDSSTRSPRPRAEGRRSPEQAETNHPFYRNRGRPARPEYADEPNREEDGEYYESEERYTDGEYGDEHAGEYAEHEQEDGYQDDRYQDQDGEYEKHAPRGERPRGRTDNRITPRGQAPRSNHYSGERISPRTKRYEEDQEDSYSERRPFARSGERSSHRTSDTIRPRHHQGEEESPSTGIRPRRGQARDEKPGDEEISSRRNPTAGGPGSLTGQSKEFYAARKEEQKVYGVAAVAALFRARPDALIKVYLLEDRLYEFRELVAFLVQKRLGYNVVQKEDLDKLTESSHHGGICALTKPKKLLEEEAFFKALPPHPKDTTPAPVLYLDGVENPHNIGAILRTAAHFGVRWVLVPAQSVPSISSGIFRISEGGAEHTDLVALDSPLDTLKRLKQMGFALVCASQTKGNPVWKHTFTPRTVLILGAEVTGVSEPVRALAQFPVQIPGTGQVESLNVSTASSIVMSEYFRGMQAAAPATTKK